MNASCLAIAQALDKIRYESITDPDKIEAVPFDS